MYFLIAIGSLAFIFSSIPFTYSWHLVWNTASVRLPLANYFINLISVYNQKFSFQLFWPWLSFNKRIDILPDNHAITFAKQGKRLP